MARAKKLAVLLLLLLVAALSDARGASLPLKTLWLGRPGPDPTLGAPSSTMDSATGGTAAAVAGAKSMALNAAFVIVVAGAGASLLLAARSLVVPSGAEANEDEEAPSPPR